MRILIDLQGAQSTGSRNRGIGRYSQALALGIARNAGPHEVWVALNDLFPDTIEPVRAVFDGLVPQDRIVVWQSPAPVADIDEANYWRRGTAEVIRESFLSALRPDVVHLSSLFEGLVDNAVTSIGGFNPCMPTSMTLYDLIPYIHRNPYLANPVVERWYLRKIDHLRRARLWLSISESSRREGIEWLDLPPDSVVNVSTAADPCFVQRRYGADEANTVRHRYGLVRPFVMYTGGIDHRKNIEGLIRAYARLPAAIRGAHQLAIVCAVQPEQRLALMREAERAGLASNDLVLTGYVSEGDLVALYNLCAVFIFPSWHEGFGLPALEAMHCGAAVIGADTSSVPEVIGRPDALFDPRSEERICQKLHEVLTDEKFRGSLQKHGLEQAKKFSWDGCAKRALHAFEHLHAESTKLATGAVAVPAVRPRLAYVSPLPPEKSGIADYSAELLPDLAQYYGIDVVVDQQEISDPWIRANCTIRDPEWFDQNAHRYDRILYHFGNSSFHQHMFGLLARHPGTVVLHDFFLSGIAAHMELTGNANLAWVSALYASHGYGSCKERYAATDMAEVIWRYPANLGVLQGANGVVVHSRHSINLAESWYGATFAREWAHIPLLRKAPVEINRSAARAELGLSDEDFLVCSFGMLGPTKLNHRLIDAWLASPLSQDERCQLVFVGENHPGGYGQDLLLAIKQARGRITITGFATPEIYKLHLAAADTAVQLRTNSRGETSAAVLDCMAYGLPTIVNAHGSNAEIPADCVQALPDVFQNEDLVQALTDLQTNPGHCKAIGARARHYVGDFLNPRRIARQYRDAIENFALSGPQSMRAAQFAALARTDDPPLVDKAWLDVAQATSTIRWCDVATRQLLVDVSELVPIDAKSGIQRVVRSVLNCLIAHPPKGFRVEPVYGDHARVYRYAREFTARFLDIPPLPLEDDVVEIRRGDVFLGLNPATHTTPACGEALRSFRRQGVEIWILVYDLLRVQHPQYFVSGVDEQFARWLDTVAEVGDGALCISRSVADELVDWLDGAQPRRHRPLKVSWFLPGADIVSGLQSDNVPKVITVLLAQLRERRSILMVGAVEPRQGHNQALDAFESLWAAGVDVNLVIIGKQGWMAENLAERLRQHPDAGRRLFWLESIADETLIKFYEAAAGVLVAAEAEGFALPLFEAGRHGCPILARDLPVFREVAGEHALYFSGEDSAVLAESLSDWLHALAAGTSPRPEGIRWQTWEQSTEQLLDLMLHSREIVQWRSGERWHFRANDHRLHTQVGVRTGGAVRTDGRSGCLIFGPYCPVPAGRYRLTVEGWLRRAAGARVDLTSAKGQTLLGESLLDAADTTGPERPIYFALDFSLQQPCEDLEVRVWVTEESDLTINTYAWKPIVEVFEDQLSIAH